MTASPPPRSSDALGRASPEAITRPKWWPVLLSVVGLSLSLGVLRQNDTASVASRVTVGAIAVMASIVFETWRSGPLVRIVAGCTVGSPPSWSVGW